MTLTEKLKTLPISIEALILKEIEYNPSFVPYIKNILNKKDFGMAVFISLSLVGKRMNEGKSEPYWKYLRAKMEQRRHYVGLSGLGEEKKDDGNDWGEIASGILDVGGEILKTDPDKEVKKKAGFYIADARKYPYDGYEMTPDEALAWAKVVVRDKIKLVPNYIEHWVMNERHKDAHHKYIDAGEEVPAGYLYTGNVQGNAGRMVVYQEHAVGEKGGIGTKEKQIFAAKDLADMKSNAKKRDAIIDKFRKEFGKAKETETQTAEGTGSFVREQINRLSPELARTIGIEDKGEETKRVNDTTKRRGEEAKREGERETSRIKTPYAKYAMYGGAAVVGLIVLSSLTKKLK